jgi:TM2 domain-containing membrane protein YozV
VQKKQHINYLNSAFYLLIFISLFTLKISAEKNEMLLLSSLVIPGSGQALFGHPVKGGTLLGFEALFAGIAYYEDLNKTQFYNTQWLNTQDSIISFTGKAEAAQDTGNQNNFQKKVRSLSLLEVTQQGDYKNSQELRNMYLFWFGGLYLYNVMDALELGVRLKHPVKGEKSPKIAVFSSMFFPGAGQLYNGSYSKAGMIWMAQTACIASGVYRHQLMSYYRQKADEAKTITISDSTDAVAIRQLENQKKNLEARFNDYRRARNSFAWYSLGIYFYNVFDALVDAHLHNFNDRMEITISPDPVNEKLQITGRFKI